MILDYSESKLKRRYKAVLTKPHQPFFILGTAVALYGVLIAWPILNGYISADLRLMHAFNMALLMPTSLFLGFLMTVLYRFLLVMPFLQKEYMNVFWYLLAGALCAQVGFLFFPIFTVVGFSLVFISQALALKMFFAAYKKSNVEERHDPFWILVSFCFGAISSILFILSLLFESLQTIAVNIALYAFATGTVFAVAQKMVPNFFTLYYGVIQPKKEKAVMPVIIASLFAIAVFKSLSMAAPTLIADIFGAAASMYFLWKNRFIFRVFPSILWILQIGMVWFTLGFVGGIAESITKSVLLQVHIFGAGFISTMAIGFGSRVALGHSGRKIEADKLTTTIFITFSIVVLIRLFATIEPLLLNIGIYGWGIVFTVWLAKYIPMLTSD